MRWLVVALIPGILAASCGSKSGEEDATDTYEEIIDTRDDTVADPDHDITDVSSDASDTMDDADLADGPGPDSGCTSDGECDDGDPCTTDTCVMETGECTHEARVGLFKLIADQLISEDGGEHSKTPSLAWTGTEYGVSWFDRRDGNREIYFSRIDADGAEIGTDVRSTESGGDSWNPALVWAGSVYGVSWYDERDGNSEIYFVRIGADGTKIGADSRITNAVGDSMYPSLIHTGTDYGVSWQDRRDGNREIYFARIDLDGVKIGTDVRVTNDGADSYNPLLAWSGSEFGVSWYDGRDGNTEIYFVRIAADGTKIDPDVRITNDLNRSRNPWCIWTGSEFVVSWNDNRDGNEEIYFTRIGPDGAEVGVDVRITNNGGSSSEPSIAFTGTGYGVSWIDWRDGNASIYFAHLALDGTKIGTDIKVAAPPHISERPWLVWAVSEWGVAWCDFKIGHPEIYFNRLGFCE